MREILFRMHDGVKMIYDGLVIYNGELYEDWRAFEDGIKSDNPLMQYTGLDDKNGVKIFEGDILRGSMVNLIVAYEGAGFIAYWMDHDYGYGTEKMWCNLVEGGEVIGNIHDNPELMGETK